MLAGEALYCIPAFRHIQMECVGQLVRQFERLVPALPVDHIDRIGHPVAGGVDDHLECAPLSDTWTSLMRSFGAAPFTSSLVSFMICPMWLSRSWYAFSQSTPVTCNHLQFLSDHCIDARLLPDGAGGSFRHLQKFLRL